MAGALATSEAVSWSFSATQGRPCYPLWGAVAPSSRYRQEPWPGEEPSPLPRVGPTELLSGTASI